MPFSKMKTSIDENFWVWHKKKKKKLQLLENRLKLGKKTYHYADIDKWRVEKENITLFHVTSNFIKIDTVDAFIISDALYSNCKMCGEVGIDYQK